MKCQTATELQYEQTSADGKKRKGTLCTSAAQLTRGSSSTDSKEPTPHQHTAAHPDKLADTTVSSGRRPLFLFRCIGLGQGGARGRV